MEDIRMIGTDGSSASAIRLDSLAGRWWVSIMEKSGFEQRIADCGPRPILSQVTVLSSAETKAINEAFRREVEAKLKASKGGIVQDLYRGWLDCANQVDELLAAIGKAGSFFQWVIVETEDKD